MSRLGFTPMERRYVARIAYGAQRSGRRLAFYAAFLTPICAFAVYGVTRQDVVALALAFAELAAFMAWRIAQEIASAPLFRSVFSKIEAFESAPVSAAPCVPNATSS